MLVGRAEELRSLGAALDRAGAGVPQAVLVGGEAGVGKTRLLEEFAGRAERAGAVVAVGGCLELGAEGLPFAPFATALRALHRALGDELGHAARGGEAELARLLPELAGAGGAEESADRHDAGAKARLFEHAARLLEKLAAERTVVVALEDLHWSDRSTRELLGYLIRSLQGARVVLLGTYRSDDIHRRHPLRPFLAELERLRTVERVDLARFSRQEVIGQITAIQGTGPLPHQVDTIFQRSDGNPFFVEELTALLDCGGSPAALSESLRDLLLVRVETLPEATQRVLRTAAEAGSTVEFGLLLAVSGQGEEELIEALRPAVDAGILLPAADGPGADSYRFRHALLREATGDDLLPGERSRLHRRYAEALAADPALVRPEECAARLASHWYHARDAAKALPAALQAAEEAGARHAFAEQLALLERAIELWDEVPEELWRELPVARYAESYPLCRCSAQPHLHFLDLLAEAVVAARLDDAHVQARTLTRRALELLDEAREPERAAWFWLERQWQVVGSGGGDGWAELGRAQELVADRPPSPVKADVLATAALWKMLHSPDPASIPLAESAVEQARLVGAEEVELHARITLATLRTHAADVERGLAELHELREAANRLGAPTVIGRAHNNLASVLEMTGRSREAIEAARAGLVAVREHGLRDSVAFIGCNMVDAMISVGDWEPAERELAGLRSYGAQARTRAFAALAAAWLALYRGDVDRAGELLADARKEAGASQAEPQGAFRMVQIEARILMERGRYAQARAALAEGLAQLPELGHESYLWQLLVSAAAAEGDARGLPGTAEGREELLDLLEGAAGQLDTPTPVWAAWRRYFTAELARARGRSEVALWESAASALEPLERPYELGWVRYRWAEALLAGGAAAAVREPAARLLMQAHATAAALGAAPLRDGVEQLAARARVPLTGPGDPAAAAEPADPAEALGLTARETDVLRLVTAGRSNRQIAEELFISPKTASVHVSNLMAKLGVSNRGEAAAVAHRLRLFESA
ncbi:AAA family ATPase [Streptomyces sp. WMMC500]|uniref:ATP-binding protein n=1 Tax=Streptomyces sp. WMMC500 TaxID=3015154 RepID=UPI00248B2E48|nr:helix-turn-helix transcriptional regulator [Streptomyces sp. WMMC500]WBB64446.1 AAA family ATPase [Streptomyces sp. WMMC500]